MSKSDLARPAGDDIWTPLSVVAIIALVVLSALIVDSVDASRKSVAPDAPLAAMNEAYLTADGPQPEPSYPANPRAPAVAAR